MELDRRPTLAADHLEGDDEIHADLCHQASFALKWSDLMELKAAPVIEDAQLVEVLGRA
jgi:Domain of unknown function (DUF3303)